MKLRIFIWVIASFFLNLLNAQTFDFGNVTAFEVSETKDDHFQDVPAVILYNNINYEVSRSFEVHLRIKIYNKKGYEHAYWEIPYKNVKSLKAITYNIVNGTLVKTKVSKEGIIRDKKSKNLEIRKVIFPNVKEGSVLELKYKIKNVNPLTIFSQNTLPIKFYKLKIKNPSTVELNIRDNPYVKLPIKAKENRSSTVFVGYNIPALVDEKFVGNINNHRGKFLLYPDYDFKTWESLARFLNRADWFGGQLRKRNSFYEETVDDLIINEETQLDKAKIIYNYVKKNMRWNNHLGLVSNGIKKADERKEGNIADINLLLVSMLQYSGLKANPMILSSKQNGWVLYPSFRDFDAVICALELNNKVYRLDASNENGGFGQLPKEFNNGNGLVIYNNDKVFNCSSMIIEKSKNKVIVNSLLDVEDLKISGDIKNQLTKYFAWEFRDQYKDSEEEAYKTEIENKGLLEVTNLKKNDIDEVDKPINISFDFEYKDCIEVVNDKLYFEPLLFFGKKENEFNEGIRKYPIDINFPYVYEFIIYYNIPVGYKVESLPSNKNLKIKDNIGDLIFNIDSNKTKVQVSLKLSINNSIILADYYEYLYTLFNEYSIISNSKIVLVKT